MEDVDAERQQALDDLCRIAAHAAGADAALVTFVGPERIEVRARWGISPGELPRDGCLCGRVVASAAPMVVEDLPAFLEVARVQEPEAFPVLSATLAGFGAYLGLPLADRGAPFGTLCVLRRAPGAWPEACRAVLPLIARQVVDQLALQQRSRLVERGRGERDWLVRFFTFGMDMFCTANQDLYFEELNPSWERALGWSLDELRSRPFTSFVHPDDLMATYAESDRLAAGSVTLDFQNRYRHKDGRWVPLAWHATVRDGKFYATARDMTAQEAQRTELMRRMWQTAELSSRLKGILSSVHHAVIETELDGTIREFNAAAERMLGYTAGEVVGRATPELIHDPEEMRAAAEEARLWLGARVEPGFDLFRKVLMRLPVYERVWTYLRKDGTTFPVHLSVTARRGPDGALLGFIGIARDITADRDAEARLAASQAQLAQVTRLLDRTEDAIFIFDPVGMRFTYTNQGATRLLGYDAEMLGRLPPSSLVLDADAVVALLAAADAAEPTVRVEVTAVRSDGRLVPVDLVVQALREEHGEERYIAVARDISERRRVDRLKDEFVSAVSHELRTPLTSIRGALGLLAGGALGELPEEASSFVRLAVQHTDRLIRLVNDILDMEKVRSGRLTFHLVVRDVAGVAGAAVAGMAGLAAMKNVAVRLQAPAVPALARVDVDRLEQVLTNLLSNALKYSPPGAEVDVVVEAPADRVRVTVIDRGPGVPEAFRDRIFEPFAQADGRLSRELGGTGLGLSISRGLIEQMGGRIGFVSEPGQGSHFWVELPTVREGAVAGEGG